MITMMTGDDVLRALTFGNDYYMVESNGGGLGRLDV